MRVGFNDFMDFTAKSGRPRITKVRDLLTRGPYDPKTDFWKRMRETVQRFHRHQRNGAPSLELLANCTDCDRKRDAYRAASKGYLRFLANREIQSFVPPVAVWQFGELEVSVGPELGLILDGTPYVLKWFLRRTAIKAEQMRECSFLLPHLLSAQCASGTRFGILRPSRGNLVPADSDPGLLPLLEADALAFVRIWHSLQTFRKAAA